MDISALNVCLSDWGDSFSKSDEGSLHTLGLVPTMEESPLTSHLPGFDNVIADQGSKEVQTSAE